MAPNVGLNVLEVDGPAAPGIQAAPTSVAAFLGATERGVPDHPVRVTSPRQFRERFGSGLASGYLFYAVQGFFANGGQEAWICRVVGGTAAPASVTLLDRQGTPAPTLRLRAGFRGTEDPGPWGDRLSVTVREDPLGRTELQGDTGADATSAQLVSLDGFRVGDAVRFTDGGSVSYRRLTAVEPGTRTVSWADDQPIVGGLAQATSQVEGAQMRLEIRLRPAGGGEAEVVEEWRHLSMERSAASYAVDLLNHPFRGSRWVVAEDASMANAPSGSKEPAPISGQALVNGEAEHPATADFLGDAALGTGLRAFDLVSAQLLLVPDVHTLAEGNSPDNVARDSVVRGALDYCAGRGDCMLITSAPDRGSARGVRRSLNDYSQRVSDYVTTVRDYAAPFRASKVYGALYAGWIRVADPLAAGTNPTRFVPGDGHLAGLYGRIERERGIHKAPAGFAAQLRGALTASADFTDAEHDTLVRGAHVNGLRPTSGAGVIAAASRTLSTDSRWWFINVRRLFNFVKSSLREGLRFVRQEPHTEDLRRLVRLNVITPFLLGLWRQGVFGSGPPEDVFTVKCDVENNPPDQVSLGNFQVEVYFYPSRPAETVLITVGLQPSGGAVTEG